MKWYEQGLNKLYVVHLILFFKTKSTNVQHSNPLMAVCKDISKEQPYISYCDEKGIGIYNISLFEMPIVRVHIKPNSFN